MIIQRRKDSLFNKWCWNNQELTDVVQKKCGFPESYVELCAEKVATRGLCAIAQTESLHYKLLGGLALQRACCGCCAGHQSEDHLVLGSKW
uniref:Uncharacterized protein n=1 Tax=Phocoena sinus TaxID=42100 RepID=A0A8C9DZP2_PHOSS